MTAITTFRNTA